MKIRNGFVSNSSSSSFIIAIDGKENPPCPHCGRKDVDFIDLLKRGSYNSDSRISRATVDMAEYMEELASEVKSIDEELLSLQDKDPSQPLDQRYHDWTIGKHINSIRRDKSTNLDLIEKIQRALDQDLSVYDIEIDNHDEILNDLFKELCDNGQITIIHGEDL